MLKAKVIIKLQGGLGNQMFQYAAARGLVNGVAEVGLDTGFLLAHSSDTAHFTAREFELGIFRNLSVYSATAHKLSLFKSQAIYYKLLRAFQRRKPIYIKQPDANYMALPDFQQYQIYLEGYFQSAKYFEHIRQQLLNDFEFPALDDDNKALQAGINTTINAVSIHIRRGDYVRSSAIRDVHGLIPLSYYKQAIAYLKAKYDQLTFYVFSDDISWAKENLNLPNAYFISHNTGKESWKDMALMTKCTHHIIANSSFSWWGAWLAQRPGTTIAPAQWFNPRQVIFNIDDYIPKNWIVIANAS
ncbi:alpha-1,2-fucosyltransferase [Mucilaginibacter sp. HD30]